MATGLQRIDPERAGGLPASRVLIGMGGGSSPAGLGALGYRSSITSIPSTITRVVAKHGRASYAPVGNRSPWGDDPATSPSPPFLRLSLVGRGPKAPARSQEEFQ